MEFFNYKPEEVKIGDIVIGKSKVRFRDTVFSAHLGDTPRLEIWPEKATTYLDGREFFEQQEKLVESLDLNNLGRSIVLYHPVTGVEIGTISIGEIIGIVYSLCIDSDKRAEEVIRLANEESTTTTTNP